MTFRCPGHIHQTIYMAQTVEVMLIQIFDNIVKDIQDILLYVYINEGGRS